MKRKDLIKSLLKRGCYLLRHGSRHDIYINPVTGMKQPVPRHREIDNKLVSHILKHLGL
ncbi:MAG: type II toxin-antitoxin system HicA family toxin [Candidatus Fermentibacteria bacterium]|nr:type II toxin-antitoxin system HicA family toxin [Candidatus Fermentibacteria bacterium]